MLVSFGLITVRDQLVQPTIVYKSSHKTNKQKTLLFSVKTLCILQCYSIRANVDVLHYIIIIIIITDLGYSPDIPKYTKPKT